VPVRYVKVCAVGEASCCPRSVYGGHTPRPLSEVESAMCADIRHVTYGGMPLPRVFTAALRQVVYPMSLCTFEVRACARYARARVGR